MKRSLFLPEKLSAGQQGAAIFRRFPFRDKIGKQEVHFMDGRPTIRYLQSFIRAKDYF